MLIKNYIPNVYMSNIVTSIRLYIHFIQVSVEIHNISNMRNITNKIQYINYVISNSTNYYLSLFL